MNILESFEKLSEIALLNEVPFEHAPDDIVDAYKDNDFFLLRGKLLRSTNISNGIASFADTNGIASFADTNGIASFADTNGIASYQ